MASFVGLNELKALFEGKHPRKPFGGSTLANSANTDDLTTAAQLLAANASRLVAHILNNHATTIVYLGKDASVTTDDGFKLDPAEVVTLKTQGAIFAIASAAPGDIRILEETE
jgi:glycine/D-amino acid oxidase-like deaminating enzyme